MAAALLEMGSSSRLQVASEDESDKLSSTSSSSTRSTDGSTGESNGSFPDDQSDDDTDDVMNELQLAAVTDEISTTEIGIIMKVRAMTRPRRYR